MGRLLAAVLLSAMACAQVPPAQTSEAAAEAGQPEERSVSVNLLPDLPPLPRGTVTVIGGTVWKLDRVRDRLTIRVFGGGDLKAAFDGRTTVYRDNRKDSQRDIRVGQRVYVDTVRDGSDIFARTIYLFTEKSGGEGHGQIVSYDAGKGELLLRDTLSPAPVKLRLSASTAIRNGEKTVSSTELRPGSLVSVDFRPDGLGSGTAREITILAMPGAAITFVGRVVHLDLRAGMVVLMDLRDKKTYDIYLGPATTASRSELREGADAMVVADFDGGRYLATSITVNTPSGK